MVYERSASRRAAKVAARKWSGSVTSAAQERGVDSPLSRIEVACVMKSAAWAGDREVKSAAAHGKLHC